MKSLFSAFITISMIVTLLASCQKKVVPGDIYGYWRLENDVKFEDKAFTLLELDRDTTYKYSNFIDPVVSDTIYCYSRAYVDGRELVLVTFDGKREEYKIKELHDSIFVISDFPGASEDLRFKCVEQKVNTIREECAQWEKHKPVKASELPEDSLDIIMKSPCAIYYFKDTSDSVHILTKEELNQVRDLLKPCMNSKDYMKNRETIVNGIHYIRSARETYRYEDYIKQYISYYKNGDLIVYVNMLCETDITDTPFPYTDLKTQFYVVHDGGARYADAEINLTKKKVIGVSAHGDG